jgi:DNA repair exonuclease SbcCD ATPase subunit
MKLTLTNFLCHESRIFEFDDNGLTLLSGVSGAGKTTIVKAVMFALFGTGTKVQTYGSSSCSVELELPSIHIIRTKRPNHLRVAESEVQFEDEAAQAIINKMFGETFKSYGYIQQNQLNSFILMSPTDKLIFLEHIGFSNMNLSEMKTTCKHRIQECNNSVLSSNARAELQEHMLNATPPPKRMRFPIRCKPERRDQAIKKVHVRIHNRNVSIASKTAELEKLTTEINETNILNATVSGYEEAVTKLTTKFESLNEVITPFDESKLHAVNEQLKHKIRDRKRRELERYVKEQEHKLAEMKVIEQETMKNEIEQPLWVDHTEQEVSDTIDMLLQTKEDLVRLDALHKKYNALSVNETECNKIEKSITQLEQELSYTCPSCNHSLQLKHDILVEYADGRACQRNRAAKRSKVKSLTELLTRTRATLQTKLDYKIDIDNIVTSYDELPILKELISDLDYMREYQSEQRVMMKRKEHTATKLRLEQFSTSYMQMEMDTSSKRADLDRYSDNNQTHSSEHTEDELRDMFDKLKRERDDMKRLKQEIDSCHLEIAKYNELITTTTTNHIAKWSRLNPPDDIRNTLKSEINLCISERDKAQSLVTLIDEWKTNEKERQRWEKLRADYNTSKTEVQHFRMQHSAAVKLKQHILETESKVLQDIIQTINTHARIYLDAFFQEHPISVQLCSHRKAKNGATTKPEINVSVEYKGMEAVLSMLSGGEVSRIVLAFSLALAEMFNTPLLLLDECTANLDQEATGVVFETISEHFRERTVIAIAHQVVTGSFENCIHLE